ncbi:MAG: DNA mismatch endonuclease Vsr [Nitrospinae bacterium]|nr:DNA mismatch endonuclease Vsr [Nitrospinota bacterium]
MDSLSKTARSKNMRAIRGKGMKPELTVRRIVHRLGFRYRLHRAGLPGKPDLVFSSRRKVIFIHGCFWHQHAKSRCVDSRIPKSNVAYWRKKLAGNQQRDRKNLAALRKAGWKALVVWECEIKNERRVTERIVKFLSGDSTTRPLLSEHPPQYHAGEGENHQREK